MVKLGAITDRDGNQIGYRRMNRAGAITEEIWDMVEQTGKRRLKIRFKTATNGEAYAVIVAGNGEPLFRTTETYKNKSDCRDITMMVKDQLPYADVVEFDEADKG